MHVVDGADGFGIARQEGWQCKIEEVLKLMLSSTIGLLCYFDLSASWHPLSLRPNLFNSGFEGFKNNLFLHSLFHERLV